MLFNDDSRIISAVSTEKLSDRSGSLELNSLNIWQKTKALKITVFLTVTAWPVLSCFSFKMSFPLNVSIRRTVTWYKL
jgi:hypothetical protein